MGNKGMVLVQAPYFEDYGPMRKAAGTYFPVGLGYISSFLKQCGYKTALFDPNVQDLHMDQIVDSIYREKPACVGISFMTPQFFWTRDFARVLKKASPEIPIVLGGAHPSALPEQTLLDIPNADYVIFGEGEQTTIELLDYLTKEKRHLAEIEGLVWRRNGEVIVNNPRDPIADLDTLPFPDRDLIDQHMYRAQSFLSYSLKAMTIYTSRGCPGRCIFCASGHKLRSRVRERSIANVIREIDYLREKFSIHYLLIKDDTFTLRPSRVEEFCDAISERHPTLKWHCMVRVNSVNKRLLGKMKSAGLNDVFLGIESGNNEILKKAKKGITVGKTREVVETCSQLGIRSYGAFILGLPGDTAETIEQTIGFACSLPLTMAGFSILIPYPGTQVFEEYYRSNVGKIVDYHQFIASTGIHYVEGYTGLDGMDLKALPALISQAQKRFYLRPRQILRMLRFSTPSMLRGFVKGSFALSSKEIYLRSLRPKSTTTRG